MWGGPHCRRHRSHGSLRWAMASHAASRCLWPSGFHSDCQPRAIPQPPRAAPPAPAPGDTQEWEHRPHPPHPPPNRGCGKQRRGPEGAARPHLPAPAAPREPGEDPDFVPRGSALHPAPAPPTGTAHPPARGTRFGTPLGCRAGGGDSRSPLINPTPVANCSWTSTQSPSQPAEHRHPTEGTAVDSRSEPCAFGDAALHHRPTAPSSETLNRTPMGEPQRGGCSTPGRRGWGSPPPSPHRARTARGTWQPSVSRGLSRGAQQHPHPRAGPGHPGSSGDGSSRAGSEFPCCTRSRWRCSGRWAFQWGVYSATNVVPSLWAGARVGELIQSWWDPTLPLNTTQASVSHRFPDKDPQDGQAAQAGGGSAAMSGPGHGSTGGLCSSPAPSPRLGVRGMSHPAVTPAPAGVSAPGRDAAAEP